MTVSHDERQESTPSIATTPGSPALERDRFGVALSFEPLLACVFADSLPLRFKFWDGSELGPTAEPGAVVIRSRRALTRLLWSPDELGLARAFVTGDIDVKGDIGFVLRELRDAARIKQRVSRRAFSRGLLLALRLGALRVPPPHPEEEVHLRGSLHSKRRDAAAVTHHYDVGNEFYRLVLGPTMTYSCARFEDTSTTLEDAQQSKHELICRKLGLQEIPHARLLDIGCGWGSMAIHAAANFDAQVTGITLSPSQAELARARVRAAGLEKRVEILLQDYRDLRGETFDAISSIGMFEHVGSANMGEYFNTLFELLAPKGRLLNHAISKPNGSKMHGRKFTNRYVFPDGELIDIADVIGAMERARFEVRDVESLREHYATTLRCWVNNLEGAWDQAVGVVGDHRARIWSLYMAASANNFEDNSLSVHQILGVVPSAKGASNMAPTRSNWG
jgi:cyclopropane-fatty-acyl-phospholipid synthase